LSYYCVSHIFDRVTDTNIPILFELLQNHRHLKPRSDALILDIFKTLGLLDSNAFAAGDASARRPAVRAIGHFMLSTSMNEIYLFLSCLECMDVANWAEASPNRPPTLQVEAFDRIMQMLNVSDETIRKKASISFKGIVNSTDKNSQTMKLIKRVDSSLPDMHMAFTTELLIKNPADSRTVTILLDLILVQHNEDGSEYASRVLEIIKSVDESTTKPRVSKQIVETVLRDLRVSCKRSEILILISSRADLHCSKE